MILKNQVEWALHCCAVLAGLPTERYLATRVLAEFHGVPKEYLSKALQALSQAGIVTSTLGPTGGYRLAQPAESISFLDIVEAIEGRRATFACTEIRRNNPCRPSDACEKAPCAIARVMWAADEAWRSRLRAVRLSDIALHLLEYPGPEALQRNMTWLLTHN
ncbi:Rrf2 family transcriptional regulator [Asticcacaulis sp. EMRT-3]|uniref:RrF2 family transcriptional regulator n=1 Tax=Asticcacaulis sp. EMRT-3 TaxID=3040349 RepID=UPI0024AFD998|nr:Rrf2 family transcriptional regulator [Asticcacaulis sp. EMRT-3]MDI7774432.1 Rrf2 family transcriptional regulator [Asticcacaulis sp. EMRT-3]